MTFKQITEEKIRAAIKASKGNLRRFADELGMSLHQAFRELEAWELAHLLYEQRNFHHSQTEEFREKGF